MLRNLKGLDDSDEDSSSKHVSTKKISGQTALNANSKYTTQEFEDSTQKESSKQMSKNTVQPIQETVDQNEIAIDEDDDDSNDEAISAQFE